MTKLYFSAIVSALDMRFHLKRLDRKEAAFQNVGKYSPLDRRRKCTRIPTTMTN